MCTLHTVRCVTLVAQAHDSSAVTILMAGLRWIGTESACGDAVTQRSTSEDLWQSLAAPYPALFPPGLHVSRKLDEAE